MRDSRQTIAAIIASCLLLATAAGQTQAPPSTDVFLTDMQGHGSRLKFGHPVNITNRDGYDNQPAFMPNGASLLFVSIREGSQPDVYRYNLWDHSTVQVTATTEGEFSPTPFDSGRFFSVIRVEADQTQRLWKFPAGGGAPELVLENIKPVGYHCWLDENTVALFVLGKPATLQIADIRTGKAEIVESNIGRSLQLRPGDGALTFVHKVSAGEWLVKALDPKTRKTSTITSTLAGSEDLAWTPDGVILMASGSKLFSYNPKGDREWRQVADFADARLTNITRLAVSPKGDKIALVGLPSTK